MVSTYRALFGAGIMLYTLYGFITNIVVSNKSAFYDRKTEAHGDCVHGEVLELIREAAET